MACPTSANQSNPLEGSSPQAFLDFIFATAAGSRFAAAKDLLFQLKDKDIVREDTLFPETSVQGRPIAVTSVFWLPSPSITWSSRKKNPKKRRGDIPVPLSRKIGA